MPGTQKLYSGNVEIPKVYSKPEEISTKDFTRNSYSRSKAKSPLKNSCSTERKNDHIGRETYTFLPTEDHFLQ